MSEVIYATCPKCGQDIEDLDGFGVLVHDVWICGWCSHPDVYGSVCRTCNTAVPTPLPLPTDADAIDWLYRRCIGVERKPIKEVHDA